MSHFKYSLHGLTNFISKVSETSLVIFCCFVSEQVCLTLNLIEKELQKGNYVCLALIDFSLDFDTLECKTILPTKLKHYGANDNTISFFKRFFTYRKQYTEWNRVRLSPLEPKWCSRQLPWTNCVTPRRSSLV